MSMSFPSLFTASDLSVRYREPFVTAALNAKSATINPSGIYRGFGFTAGGSNFTIAVTPATEGDHVAVYEVGAADTSAAHYALTVRKKGTFSLDLTSMAAVSPIVVTLVLFASFTVGGETLAEIRAYTASEWTALPSVLRGELLILGSCTIPASGSPAPITNYSYTGRSSAWSRTAPEAVPWAQIIGNHGFDSGLTATTSTYAISRWLNRTDLAVNGSFRLTSSGGGSGSRWIEFNKTSASASTATLEQPVELTLVEGQRVRVVARVKQLLAITAGSVDVALAWGDADDASLASSSLVLSAGVDASFRIVEATFQAPTSAFFLKSVSLRVVGAVSATGSMILVDDVSVFVETGSFVQAPRWEDRSLDIRHFAGLTVEDPLNYLAGQIASLLRFDRASPTDEGRLLLERRDQDYAGSKLPPALDVLGRLFLGTRLQDTSAEALKPRISTPVVTTAGAGLTLLWEALPNGLKGVRFYAGDLVNATAAEAGMLITVNARFDGTNWVKDLNGEIATALHLTASNVGIRALRQAAGTNTWSPSSWIVRPGVDGEGSIFLGAADFRPGKPQDIANGEIIVGDAYWYNGTTDLTATLPLHLGARLASISWSTNRGGAGTQTLQLRRRLINGSGTGETVGSVTTLNTGSSEVETLISYNLDLDPAYSYFLLYTRTSAANQLIGAKILRGP